MLNPTGFAAALATFFGVWLGHVAVRKIEAQAVDIRLPMVVCILLGVGMEAAALLTESRPLAAALGIVGVTLWWDALEFVRQEKRVKVGHAPANPCNPRHARILAAYPQATTLDWLERDPRGAPYSADELRQIAEGR
ncbi:MAG: DUF4491 family protein [Anaerolineales bacterium]